MKFKFMSFCLSNRNKILDKNKDDSIVALSIKAGTDFIFIGCFFNLADDFLCLIFCSDY